jgi:hypothetical protein
MTRAGEGTAGERLRERLLVLTRTATEWPVAAVATIAFVGGFTIANPLAAQKAVAPPSDTGASSGSRAKDAKAQKDGKGIVPKPFILVCDPYPPDLSFAADGDRSPTTGVMYGAPTSLYAIACVTGESIRSQKVWQNGVDVTASYGSAAVGSGNGYDCVRQVKYSGNVPSFWGSNTAVSTYPNNPPAVRVGRNVLKETACAGTTGSSKTACMTDSTILSVSNVKVEPMLVGSNGSYDQPNGPGVYTAIPRQPSTQPFRITNVSNASATFALSLVCNGAAVIGCGGLPSSVTIAAGQAQVYTVTYTAGDSNTTGLISLKATYGANVVRDSAATQVTSRWTNYTTFSVHGANDENQSTSFCAGTCGRAMQTVSTVPYFSNNAGRAVSLVYNGDRQSLRPFLYADVLVGYHAYPIAEYWLEARRADGARITFTNGEQRLRFSGAGTTYAASTPYRLATQFDAAANGMSATQVYPMTVSVTTVYQNGHQEVATVSTGVIVVNERTSGVASGWSIGGVQRAYPQVDSSVLVTEGDGSALLFRRVQGAFVSPKGDFSLLTALSGGGYARSYPDSTVALFGPDGHMTYKYDAYRVGTQYWEDTNGRVTRIYDPVRHEPYSGNAYTTIEYAADGNGISTARRTCAASPIRTVRRRSSRTTATADSPR